MKITDSMKFTIAFVLLLVSRVACRNVRRSSHQEKSEQEHRELQTDKEKSQDKHRELQTDATVNPLRCRCIINCTVVNPNPNPDSGGEECLVFEEVCQYPDGTACSPSGSGEDFTGTGPTIDFCQDVPAANGGVSLATFPADSPVVSTETTYSMTVTTIPSNVPASLCVVFDFTNVVRHIIRDGSGRALSLRPPTTNNVQMCYSDTNGAFTEFLAGLVNCPTGYTVTILTRGGAGPDTRPVRSAEGGPFTTSPNADITVQPTTTATTAAATTAAASTCTPSNTVDTVATNTTLQMRFISGAGIPSYENQMMVLFPGLGGAPLSVAIFLFAITEPANNNNVVYSTFAAETPVFVATLVPGIFDCSSSYQVFLAFADGTTDSAPIPLG